ncbi:MAG: tetratricopeptide repeat protein [Chitinophagaceae bacterium]
MRYWIISLLCLSELVVKAQTSNEQVYTGNTYYKKSEFQKALSQYDKALSQRKNNAIAHFNKANTLYALKQMEQAKTHYKQAYASTLDKNLKADAMYNMGNIAIHEKKWDEAIASYKESLKNKPNNPNAQYNLAYAKKKKEEEQKQNNQKDKNQDPKEKDKNQDKNQEQQPKQNQQDPKEKEKQQDKQKQEQEEKNKQEQDQKNQEQQSDKEPKDKQEQNKPQPMPSKLSKQQADQLLNALSQEEKKLKEKKDKAKGVGVKQQKDW